MARKFCSVKYMNLTVIAPSRVIKGGEQGEMQMRDDGETRSDKAPGLADYLSGKPRALLVAEVAALLNVSGRQIYKLAADNRIPHLKIAGCVRFDPQALAVWLRRQTDPAERALKERTGERGMCCGHSEVKRHPETDFKCAMTSSDDTSAGHAFDQADGFYE
jgi:excisionase family DNA binding protein